MPVALRSTLDLERRRGVDLLGHQVRTANAQKSIAYSCFRALRKLELKALVYFLKVSRAAGAAGLSFLSLARGSVGWVS